MKRIIALLLCLSATSAFGVDIRKPRNRSSGGKDCLQVNVAGTMTDALCADAGSGTVAAVYGGYANVRASEGAGTTTLTSSDARTQIFNLSAARTVVLPSTGVAAGDVWTLENRTENDLTVQASAGSALTVANSANLDATIRNNSRVVLVALAAAPTTPANWRVSYVYEEYTQADTSSSNFTNLAFRIIRVGNQATLSGTENWFVTSNGGAQSTASAFYPARFRPKYAQAWRDIAGIYITFTTAGVITSNGGAGGTSVDSPTLSWTTN